MRIRTRRLTIVSMAGLALACGGDRATAPSPSASVPRTSAPRVLGLAITPDTIVMALGASAPLSAVELMSDGSRVAVNARWSSFSDAVSINSANGYAVAVWPGRAMITAQADGLVAVGTVLVSDPKSIGPSDALVVERFTVVEHQYESAPSVWFYAPQLLVHAAPGRTLTVLQLSFTIPGIGDAPGFSCGATLASAPRELNGEVYGDWAFEIGPAGSVAQATAATAIVTYVDDAGTLTSSTVHGPVVLGSGPGTYTGGQNGGACFHGYGSTSLRPSR